MFLTSFNSSKYSTIEVKSSMFKCLFFDFLQALQRLSVSTCNESTTCLCSRWMESPWPLQTSMTSDVLKSSHVMSSVLSGVGEVIPNSSSVCSGFESDRIEQLSMGTKVYARRLSSMEHTYSGSVLLIHCFCFSSMFSVHLSS